MQISRRSLISLVPGAVAIPLIAHAAPSKNSAAIQTLLRPALPTRPHIVECRAPEYRYDLVHATQRDRNTLVQRFEERLQGGQPWDLEQHRTWLHQVWRLWSLPDLSPFGPFQIYPTPISVADYRISSNQVTLWLIPYQEADSALTVQRLRGMLEIG